MKWITGGALPVAGLVGLACGACGHDLSPRLLAGEGFTVQTPGGWSRVEFPAPDKAGVQRIVYTAGHGASDFLVVIDRYANGRGPTLDAARGEPEFDGATDVVRGRYRGYEYIDAREPYLGSSTDNPLTAFVRLVVVPGATIELQNRRLGEAVAEPSAYWPAFKGSLMIGVPAGTPGRP